MKAIKPGAKTLELRKLTERLVEDELLKLGVLKKGQVKKQDPENPAVRKYFMHGVAHPIGLDVHDVAVAYQPVAAGWVLTCEPAIYLKDEGFGIRLENTVLVTENGCEDLMAAIPIEADEIEALMSRRRKRGR
jgi:Xaa-Pro aminopeptidase